MSTPDPLRVAVIGSGPAGIYTAQALTGSPASRWPWTCWTAYPTPTACLFRCRPDHTSIKRVAHTLARVLEHPDVRFAGRCGYGIDLTRADLARAYHAVVYATGASVDRRMGISAARTCPACRCHRLLTVQRPPRPRSDPVRPRRGRGRRGRRGQRSLDVARILVRSVDELRQTDIPEPVLQVLAASKVRCVHIVARRGPLQAKFSANELRELGKLTDVDVTVDPAVVDLDPNSEEVATAARAARTNLRTLAEWAQRPGGGTGRRVELHFWRKPVAVVGDTRVEGLEVEHTALDADGRLVGTGQREVLPVGMVVRSVGYASSPPPRPAFRRDHPHPAA